MYERDRLHTKTQKKRDAGLVRDRDRYSERER